jgi:hypothetical protein
MPDNTLRDILQGFNTFQQQLGLMPGVQRTQGIQPLSTPPIKHPGEISQAASIQLMQSSQALRQATTVAFMPPGGLGGGTAAGGAFAQQYQQRMGQIEAGYQDPFQAQQMAQQMGQPGFMTLPSPVFMTPPSMGAFRPGFQPPPPIMAARTPPMMQTPFTPQLPAPMFQTPMQMQQAQQQMQANESFAGAMAGIPLGARALMGGAGMALGARFGGGLGAVAGGLLGFGPAGGLAAQGTSAMLQPAVERRAFGLQMQDISRNFVVSGPELAQGGRGLSMQAGIQTSNMMRRAVDRDQTAGFNMRDMMGITSMAGDMGMMDMAQNSEQIVSQAKNVARGLSAFMRLANEPDVRRAMQQMSQMRAMGLTIPETTASMQNAQQFARMAGTTVANLGATAGMPGAMTSQQMGMTGGLGYNVGMGAGGMARQAVASGAFTPGQLNMAGGMRGIQQQLTESAGATLGINFPMMAALTRNAQGQLSIDPERARGLASGQYSLTQQAGMAQQNMEQLGGARAITELSTRLNELRDQLGRTLGPQGTLLYTLQQGRAMQKELGGAVSLGGALRAMGLNPQQARTLEITAQSPQFWQNMQQQTLQQIREARHDEAARRQQAQEYTSFSSRINRAVFQPIGDFSTRIGEGFGGMYNAVSQWFSDQGRVERAAERGGAFVRGNPMLQPASARAQRNVTRYLRSGALDRDAGRMGVETTRAGIRGQDTAMSVFNVGLNAGTAGLADAFGLSLAEPSASSVAQASQVRGGFQGWLNEALPSLTVLKSAITGDSEERLETARDIASLGRTIQLGRRMSVETSNRVDSETETLYQELRRHGGGKGPKTLEGMKGAIVTRIIENMRNNASSWKNKTMGTAQAKKMAVETAVSQGMPRATAQKLIDRAWDGGWGVSIMRRVIKEADPEVQSVLATQEEAVGVSGVEAAESYKAYQENIEKLEERTREAAGLEGGWFTGVSDAAYKAYRNLAQDVADPSELHLMQAHALMQSDDEDERAAGRAMARKLEGELGRAPYEKLLEKVTKRKVTDDQATALRAAGKTTAEQKTIEGQLKQVTDTQRGFNFATVADTIAKGATAITDATGISKLAPLAGGAATTKKGLQNIMNIGRKLTPEEMEQLRQYDPKLAEAFEKVQAGGKEGKAGAKQVRELVYQRGKLEKDVETGGKGVGGAREAGLQGELAQIGDLASQLTGDPQGDFAKTVPLFAKASTRLDKASERLENLTQIISLTAKTLKPF